MFIDQETLKRVNIYAPYKGRSKLDTPEIRAAVGVIEIADPVPPVDYSDETYYRTEQDDAPYVVFTKKSDEALLALRWQQVQQVRDELTLNGGCQLQVGEDVTDPLNPVPILKWFHSDVYSKQQQMALTMLGVNLPEGVWWKTMDGSFTEVSPEIVASLFAAQITREMQIFQTAETKRLDDTPLYEGWPDRYIEEVEE